MVREMLVYVSEAVVAVKVGGIKHGPVERGGHANGDRWPAYRRRFLSLGSSSQAVLFENVEKGEQVPQWVLSGAISKAKRDQTYINMGGLEGEKDGEHIVDLGKKALVSMGVYWRAAARRLDHQ